MKDFILLKVGDERYLVRKSTVMAVTREDKEDGEVFVTTRIGSQVKTYIAENSFFDLVLRLGS